MKKLLILTEKFPPNTETAANRPWGWAKYFHQFGYKPIIITRNWDLPFTENITYQYTPTGEKVIHQVFDHYEVYYLPYKGNCRTKFLLKYKHQKYKLVYRIMSLVEQLAFTAGFYRLTEFGYFFTFTKQLLRKNKDIKLALITGCPFHLFQLGGIMLRQFGVKWIADYRDPWTIPQGVLAREEDRKHRLHLMIERRERKAESRWTATASHITSVSEYLTEAIAGQLGKPGTTIYNGYLHEEKTVRPAKKRTDNKRFTILYNGSLYPIQQIELFLDGFKRLVNAYKDQIEINFQGIGIDFIPGAAQRVKDNLKGYESYINITGRLPKQDYLAIQDEAQVLLIAGTGPIKGITSSKIFDYILVPKPVLMVANDKDVVEKILQETGQGVFADTPEEVFKKLSILVDEYLRRGENTINYNEDSVYYYSRENQTRLMAGILDGLNQN